MAKAKKKHRFEPEFAVAPGETLRETLEAIGMSQKELATRTELTVQTISRILSGEQPITFETANRLEMVTSVPSRLWNNLEMKYREQLAKLEERERLASDMEWLKSIPTRELVNRGVLPETKDKVELLHATLSFFGVSSTDAWDDVWTEHGVAARRSQCFETSPWATAAWIRLGEVEAQQIECAPFDKKKFETALERIRPLTAALPSEFAPSIVRHCSKAGVAVVYVPAVKKVPWNGASKWLTSEKAMIQLNLRGKKDDQFWFSFFHEASHILHDSKKEMFINDGSEDDPREKKANEFAAEFLIPKKYLPELLAIRTKSDVLNLANKLNVGAGVVVGRFQRETQKYNYFNGLKKTLAWAD